MTYWSVLRRYYQPYLNLKHLADTFFYPKRLTIGTFVRGKRNNNIYHRCRYSKDVHRNKCQALTITMLTNSLYKTKRARRRWYTTWYFYSYICQNVQHSISAYIKCRVDSHAQIISHLEQIIVIFSIFVIHSSTYCANLKRPRWVLRRS